MVAVAAAAAEVEVEAATVEAPVAELAVVLGEEELVEAEPAVVVVTAAGLAVEPVVELLEVAAGAVAVVGLRAVCRITIASIAPTISHDKSFRRFLPAHPTTSRFSISWPMAPVGLSSSIPTICWAA